MARITVVRLDEDGNADVAGDEPFVSLLLWDLDRVQSLREHTIHPPGQERNIKPIDVEAVQSVLDEAGATATAEDVLADTVYVDDISLATIQTAAAGATLTADEQEEIQDLLSVRLIETGNFLLSFDNGVIAKALDMGWVKVFTDAGDELFEL